MNYQKPEIFCVPDAISAIQSSTHLKPVSNKMDESGTGDTRPTIGAYEADE